jgi:SP family myo-inositol transporter-like MFS transporter 13
LVNLPAGSHPRPILCRVARLGLTSLTGYDTGVISGTLVIIGRDLGSPLSDWQKELITSATTLGALIGGLVAGGMSDHTGRKRVITLASVVFVLGALIQAVSELHAFSSFVARMERCKLI